MKRSTEAAGGKRGVEDGEVFLGRYIMHDAMILVYYDWKELDSTVQFGWQGKEGSYIRMVIGGTDCWGGMVSHALHEVMELSMTLEKVSYTPSGSLDRNDTGRFRFFLDHDEFTDVCRHAGDMLSFLLPALKQAWKPKRALKMKGGM